ncbi:MAG TPA: TonB-dependent receptor [Terriglobales bacterium]|nr:TonB-dependent receptor [Terriglobales bacterium]
MSCGISSRTLKFSLPAVTILVVAMGLVFPGRARAQATATVNGTVRDISGAVIADAEVTLHSKATSLDRTTTSNSVGAYVIPQVQPGDYDLKVSKTGFRTQVQTNISLAVNQTATFDTTMTPGSAQETVQVQANAATLETTTSELGEVIVQDQVNDLPLNGRNFTQLLNLTPGVSTVNVSQNSATSGGVWSNPIGTFSYPAVNGQTNRSNLFLLDGVNDQGSFGSTYGVAPIVDDITEFKVQSHNDDASFGGVMGGVINVATKSGTTQYRGAAWEFLRNTAFDARNPFLTKVTPFEQNQFGAAFGGPVWIPKHSGEPKTFFYLSYEGFRNHTASANFYNTPTTQQLTGDLTGIAGQIYNPFSVVANAASPSGFSNQPFMCDASGNPLTPVNNIQPAGIPCNKMPSTMIDPNMLKYAQTVYPAPNLTGNPNFNGLDQSPVITRQDEWNVRLDHRFGDHDSIWARYTGFYQPVSGSGGFVGFVHDQTTRGYNVGVNYIHTFNSSTLMAAHFARTDISIDQGSNYTTAPPSFGTEVFAPNFAGNFIGGISMIPEVVVQSYIGNPNPSAHGAAQVDDTRVSNIWEYGGDFTKSFRHHTLKAGANFASNNSNALYLNSNVIFAAGNTANAVDLTGGNSLASFLLGVPVSAARRNVVETEHGGWVDGFYVMDQWKATSKLSVNVGLRYDLTLMPIYGDNGHNNNFVGDMNFNNGTYILARLAPSCLTSPAPCIPGGTLPANVVVTPLSNNAIYHNDLYNIQPRVGMAYQILPRTVLRGGYGRFYDNWAAITQTGQNYEGTWPDIGQLGASNLNPLTGTPTAPANDPLHLGSTSPMPAPTPFTQSTWFADPYLKRPYADMWNFGVQQQVTQSSVLTANYVGAGGRKLDIGGAYNVALTPGPGPTQPRAPYPYIGATAYDRSVGWSSYNALQVSMNGRMQRNLTYLVSYTWSKTLDLGCTGWYGVEGCSIQNPYNLKADKGPAATDLRNIFSASWVYKLPFGRGQKFTSDNRVVNALIGGWDIRGVVSLSSGIPFDVGTAKDIANTGNYNYGNGYGYERLNLIGSPYPSNKSPAQWINQASFALPDPFTFGDLGRDSLRSDSYKNVDLAVAREFPFTERWRLEFRFDMFNAFNTPVWNVPVTNVDNPNFGVVTSTYNTARQLQFALKLYF